MYTISQLQERSVLNKQLKGVGVGNNAIGNKLNFLGTVKAS